MSQYQLRPRQPGWNCWRAGDEPLGPPVRHSRHADRSPSRQRSPPVPSPAHDWGRPRRQHYDSNAHPNHVEQELGEHPNHDAEEETEESLQLWSPALDTLMRQTSRAYDLVLAYPRDAEGGLRWYASDIPRIRETGKHLHRDMWALKRLRLTVKNQGDPDSKIMQQVARDAQRMWDLCKKVQGVIRELEQKNEHELVKTREFETDEEGNVVKVSKGEGEDCMEDDMPRCGSWTGDRIARNGRNNREASSPPPFYIDTKPSDVRRTRPFLGSYSRTRSSSPRSEVRPPYDRHHRWGSRRRSHQDYESYRPCRNGSSRLNRDDSYIPKDSSSSGPRMLGKHVLHF